MAITYEPIASTSLSVDTAEINFSSISNTFTDLILVMYGRNTVAGTGTYHIRLRFNGDTGTNYSCTRLLGDGTSASTFRFTNSDRAVSGEMPRAGSTPINPGMSIAHIQSYANTNIFKTILIGNNSAEIYSGRYVNLWRNTNAITSISASFDSGLWASGSILSLYGVKAAV